LHIIIILGITAPILRQTRKFKYRPPRTGQLLAKTIFIPLLSKFTAFHILHVRNFSTITIISMVSKVTRHPGESEHCFKIKSLFN